MNYWEEVKAALMAQHGTEFREKRALISFGYGWPFVKDPESGKNRWWHIYSADGRVFSDRLWPTLTVCFDGQNWIDEKEGSAG